MQNKEIKRVQFNSKAEKRNELESRVKDYKEAMEKLGYKLLRQETIQVSSFEIATVIFMG